MAKAVDLQSRQSLICESRDISLDQAQGQLTYALSVEVSTSRPLQRPFLTFYADGSLLGISNAHNTKFENVGENGVCDIRVTHRFGNPESELRFVIKGADKREHNFFATMTINSSDVVLICEIDRLLVNKVCPR